MSYSIVHLPNRLDTPLSKGHTTLECVLHTAVMPETGDFRILVTDIHAQPLARLYLSKSALWALRDALDDYLKKAT